MVRVHSSIASYSARAAGGLQVRAMRVMGPGVKYADTHSIECKYILV